MTLNEEKTIADFIEPFKDDTASICLVSFPDTQLTIENGEQSIAIYGQLNINFDRQGLKNARNLRSLLNKIIAELEKTESDGQLLDILINENHESHAENPYL